MSQELAVRRELDEDQIELIKATIADGATNNELKLFIEQCNRTGLDPFARQIYSIKRKGRMTTQISIDGARLVAQRSGEYAGQTPVYYANEAGEWTDLWLDSMGYPSAAKVGVYRRGFVEPMWATATWNQYCVKTDDGSPTAMWRKMPALMLSKCAESLALRKAFPMELSGLYTEDEMAQADTPAPAEPQSTAKATKATKGRARSAPAQDRVVDADETAHVIGALDQLSADEKDQIKPGWVAAGIPPVGHGLTSTEAALALALIFGILEGDVVDAEIVESGENRPTEANAGNLGEYSDAPTERTCEAQYLTGTPS